jgi:single-stranded-DNA-specific exonuclease
MDSARPVLHVAGSLKIDCFGGRETVRLQIDDAATTAGSVLA